jgi:hypothetical protein
MKHFNSDDGGGGGGVAKGKHDDGGFKHMLSKVSVMRHMYDCLYVVFWLLLFVTQLTCFIHTTHM